MSCQLTRRYDAVVPGAAAAATAVGPVGVAYETEVVSSGWFIPAAAMAGSGSNGRRLRVYNRGSTDGSGAVVVAELSFTGGTTLTANTRRALTLSATPANLRLAANDVLSWETAAVASGVADPGGVVMLTTERYLPAVGSMPAPFAVESLEEPQEEPPP